MADEKILYEYEQEKNTDTRVTISYGRNRIEVFEHEDYNSKTKKEVLNYKLDIDSDEAVGVMIFCNKEWISIGAMSISMSNISVKNITVSIVDNDHISIDLKF